MTATAARVSSPDRSHWYTRDGQPMHEVIAKNGKPRPATLADARKLDLLPSVTNIQGIAAKPALESYKIEQACLAVLTAPRVDGEPLDEFVRRVLGEERQQDEDRDAAAELGTRIHAALAAALNCVSGNPELIQYISAPLAWAIETLGKDIAVEQPVVGIGYAGCCDLRTTKPSYIVADWKTTRNIPAAPYPEHCEQVAAYAVAAYPDEDMSRLQGYVCYISTSEPGKFAAYKVETVESHFIGGFLPCRYLWQHRKQYKP